MAGHARFRMLDTVRAFARRSAAGNAWAGAERRHVEYHCEMLHAAAIGVQTEDSPLWMKRMQASQADIRASIAVAFDADARYRHTHGGRFVLAVVPERQSG